MHDLLSIFWDVMAECEIGKGPPALERALPSIERRENRFCLLGSAVYCDPLNFQWPTGN